MDKSLVEDRTVTIGLQALCLSLRKQVCDHSLMGSPPLLDMWRKVGDANLLDVSYLIKDTFTLSEASFIDVKEVRWQVMDSLRETFSWGDNVEDITKDVN